jgi:mannose-6-phosphate isomerase-like protein (cupin superfamily)
VTGRVVSLGAVPLEPVVAHGGEGSILFGRIFEKGFLRSACNFADYAVIPPGCSIGKHRHGDDEEIYVILEGEGRMFLDGRVHRVGPGSVVLNRPGGEHGLVNDGTEELRIFVVEIAAPAGSAEEGPGRA